MIVVKDVLDRFNERCRNAKLLINNIPTAVEVEFDKLNMIIKNLNEFPIYLKFPRDSQEMISGYTSTDGWKTLSGEEAQQIQIYHIFDPNFVFAITTIEINEHTSFAHNYRVTFFEGRYWVEQLPLPDVVKKFFFEGGDTKRLLRARIIEDDIVSITQKEFPPFNDMITLSFENKYCC